VLRAAVERGYSKSRVVQEEEGRNLFPLTVRGSRAA
jgi:hypothetical protein